MRDHAQRFTRFLPGQGGKEQGSSGERYDGWPPRPLWAAGSPFSPRPLPETRTPFPAPTYTRTPRHPPLPFPPTHPASVTTIDHQAPQAI